MSRSALFLDRDGILNRVVMRWARASSPRSYSEFQLIEEAVELVWRAKQLGFCTVLVTNQPDIARRKMKREELEKMHTALQSTVPLDAIEVCTSADDRCFRRKPNPGMLLQSSKRLDLCLRHSLFLGDSLRDIEAGRRAGVPTILYQTSYNGEIHGLGDFNCNTFSEVLTLIERHYELYPSLFATSENHCRPNRSACDF